MKKPSLNLPVRINDAIRTSRDGNYYQVVGPGGSHWFSLTELISSEAQARVGINRYTGGVLVAGDAIRSFQESIQNYPSVRDGIVAAHPGWVGEAYVSGDGSVFTAPNAKQGVDVVSFTPLPKFTPRATLAEWQELMTPFVKDQVMPFFCVSVALSGPPLTFLPAEVMNPQIELVGPAKNGKSTLGTLASSVWAGNPHSTEGGGSSWNLTANAYDELRKGHRDMAIVLDEAEGSGTSGTGRAALASSLIFAGATTSSRRRFTDTQAAPDLKIPVLSTANTPLWEVLKREPEDARHAAMSRMFSIRIARESCEEGLRLFTTQPDGYADMGGAARALRNTVNVAYGTAGPAFAQMLVERLGVDPIGFRQNVTSKFTDIRNRLHGLAPRQDERHLDMMAAIELTATLAQEGGVLPLSWGSPHDVVEAVLGSLHTLGSEQQLELRTTWAAFGRRLCRLRDQERIVQLGLLPLPKSWNDYDAVLNPAGEQRRVMYFDPDAFAAHFKDSQKLLKTARSLGLLMRHQSEPDRHTFKAPTGMARFAGRRVYAFDVTNLPDFVNRR